MLEEWINRTDHIVVQATNTELDQVIFKFVHCVLLASQDMAWYENVMMQLAPLPFL